MSITVITSSLSIGDAISIGTISIISISTKPPSRAALPRRSSAAASGAARRPGPAGARRRSPQASAF